MTGSLPPAVAGAEVLDEELAHAIRFRTTVGFINDPAFVRASFLDPAAFPNREYGIPLTVSEAAEVYRRAQLGEAIDAAALWAEAYADAYAGAWIDHRRGGVPVFMIKDRVAGAEQGIRDRLPVGLDVEFSTAAYLLRELNAVQDTIEAARDALIEEGIPLVSTSIRVPTNTVKVGLGRLTAEHVSTLRDRYGDAISIVHDPSVAKPDACPLSDCAPVKGGIGMYSAQITNPCTTNFIVKVTTGTDYFGILTAGHCFRAGNDSGEGDDWMHTITGAPDLKIGDARKQTWYNGADADVGLIQLTSIPADKNRFYATTGRNLVTYSLSGAQQEGDLVCRTGRTSGYDCGYIIGTNESRPSEIVGIGTRTIDHQWVVDFDSVGGDSGGPYYETSTGKGIHTHSTEPGDAGHPRGWYSPLDWARVEYNNRWAVTWLYCLNDTCS